MDGWVKCGGLILGFGFVVVTGGESVGGCGACGGDMCRSGFLPIPGDERPMVPDTAGDAQGG